MHFFVFDRFIDCSNIRIYQIVTKGLQITHKYQIQKYGYNSSKNAADST